jgi:hypothetical protein
MIKDPEGLIVYLELSNYTGISLGAIHWYGKLVGKGKRVELENVLTAKHAALLNRQGWDSAYKRGETYPGFLEEEEVKRLAAGIYKDHFPQARCLLLGSPAYAEPKYILEADGHLVEIYRLNDIVTRCEPLDCEEREPWLEKWEQRLAELLGLEYVEWN